MHHMQLSFYKTNADMTTPPISKWLWSRWYQYSEKVKMQFKEVYDGVGE